VLQASIACIFTANAAALEDWIGEDCSTLLIMRRAFIFVMKERFLKLASVYQVSADANAHAQSNVSNVLSF
jgi:hypothetical protein